MIVETYLIDSLNDVDLDALFTASFTRMEKNFIWPPGLTYDQKKATYLYQLDSAVNGTWALKNDTDTFLMFVTKVDGVLVDFSAGYLEQDGIVSLRWNLASEGFEGSHNWRFTPEARDERKRFTTEIGATGYRHYTWVGSLIYRMLKLREQTGHVTLEEEPFTLPGNHGYQMVKVVVRLN